MPPALQLKVEARDKATAVLAKTRAGLESAGTAARKFGTGVVSATRKADKALTKTAAKSQNLKGSFIDLQGTMQSVFAGVGLAALVRFAETSLRAFSTQQQATQDLALAYKNLGVFTEEALQEQLDFASSIQRTTRFGDEAIISLQAQLATFGLYGDRLKDATRATLDLSVRLKISLQTAAILVGKAAQGMTNSLRSYGIVIDNTLPKNEKFAVAMATINKQMGGAAQEQIAAYAGKVTQLGNQFGDLQEQIGSFLIPGFENLATVIRKNLLIIENLTAGQQDNLRGVGLTIKATELEIATNKRALTERKARGILEGEINDALREGIRTREASLVRLREALDIDKKAAAASRKRLRDSIAATKAAEEAAAAREAGAKARAKAAADEATALQQVQEIRAAVNKEELELTGATLQAQKQAIRDELEARILAVEELRTQAGLTAESVSDIVSIMERNATAKLEQIGKKGGESFQQFGKVADAVSRQIEVGFGNAVADMILEGKSLEESMKAIFKSILRTAIATFVQIAIRSALIRGATIPAAGGSFAIVAHGDQRVPGPRGAPVAAILHGGERVIPAGGPGATPGGGGAGGANVFNIVQNIHVAQLGPEERKEIMDAMILEFRDRSDVGKEFAGQVTLVAVATAEEAT